MVDKQLDIHRNLVEESLKGSSKAQHELYKLYAGAMFYTCYNFMHSREEAKDMLQEALSEAFFNPLLVALSQKCFSNYFL